MLARIDKLDGVLDSWTNKSGTRVVVSVSSVTKTADAIAFVGSLLAPKYGVTEVTGAEADEASRACHKAAPGWFRAWETIALSREEARELAARGAALAAGAAGLDAGETEIFEKRTREALLRVFEDQHQREFDGRSLDARLRAEASKVVDDMDLAPEKKKALHEAIEAESR